MKIKRCMKCGALVEVIKDCECADCGICCCGQPMVTLLANSSDGAAEKHLPTYEVLGENIVVAVPHVMDADHHIEWIAFETENERIKKCFSPNMEAKAIFPYVKGAKIYSYCNKHGLWMAEVK